MKLKVERKTDCMENVTDVAFRVQIQSEIEECSVINAPFIEFPAL